MPERAPFCLEMLGSSPSMTAFDWPGAYRARRRDSMLSASIRAEKAIAA